MKKIKKIISKTLVSTAIISLSIAAAGFVSIKIDPIDPAKASLGLRDVVDFATGGAYSATKKTEKIIKGDVDLLDVLTVTSPDAITTAIINGTLEKTAKTAEDLGGSSSGSSGSTSPQSCIGTATEEKCAAMNMLFNSKTKSCVIDSSLLGGSIYGNEDSSTTTITVAEEKCKKAGLEFDSTAKLCKVTENFCKEIGLPFNSTTQKCEFEINAAKCSAIGKTYSKSILGCVTCTTTPTPDGTVVNGVCGSVPDATLSTYSKDSTSAALCSKGTPNAFSITDSEYSWTCKGQNGGKDVPCTVLKGSSSGTTGTTTGTIPTTVISGDIITEEWLAAIKSTYVAGCQQNTSISDQNSSNILSISRQSLMNAFTAAISDKKVEKPETLAALLVAEQDVSRVLADKNIMANASLKGLFETAQKLLRDAITKAEPSVAFSYGVNDGGTYVPTPATDFITDAEKAIFVMAQKLASNAILDSTLSGSAKADLTEAMDAFAAASLLDNKKFCPSPVTVLTKAKTACAKVLGNSGISDAIKKEFKQIQITVEAVLQKAQNINDRNNAANNSNTNNNTGSGTNVTTGTGTTGNGTNVTTGTGTTGNGTNVTTGTGTTSNTAENMQPALSASQQEALTAAQNSLSRAINDAIKKDALFDSTAVTAARNGLSDALVEAFAAKGTLSANIQAKLLSAMKALTDALVQTFAAQGVTNADTSAAQVNIMNAHEDLSKALANIGINNSLSFLFENSAGVAKSYETVPIYRFYNRKTDDHYYKNSKDAPPDYVLEGIAFHAYNNEVPNSVPIYRFYNRKTDDHYYKISKDAPPEYVSEGIAFYAYAKQIDNSVPIYRFYNRKTDDHYYVVESWTPSDYVKEGIAFYAFAAQGNIECRRQGFSGPCDGKIVETIDSDGCIVTRCEKPGPSPLPDIKKESGAVCVSTGCAKEGEFLKNMTFGYYDSKNNLRPTKCCEGLYPVIPIAAVGQTLQGASAICQKIEKGKSCAGEGEEIKNNLIERLYPLAPVNSAKPTKCCDGLEPVSLVSGPNGEKISGTTTICRSKKGFWHCAFGRNSDECRTKTHEVEINDKLFERDKGHRDEYQVSSRERNSGKRGGVFTTIGNFFDRTIGGITHSLFGR